MRFFDENKPSWRTVLAKAIRNRFRNQMRDFVLEMVQKLDERKIKKMIMNQQAVIRKALNMDGKPKWHNPYA